MLKLGVNIDHVATLRNARGGTEPDPVEAAVICEMYGADGITIHTREDQRHIRFEDARLIKTAIKIGLNLEMAPVPEILEFALKLQPAEVCLVPEKRNELTTEGGLAVTQNYKELEKVVNELRKKNVIVSIFIDPDETEIESAKMISADFIELHTGKYANSVSAGEIENELARLKKAAKFGKEIGLHVNAGHGLTYKNVRPVAAIKEIEVLNIGHSIISRAVFTGLGNAVKEMKEVMLNSRLSIKK